MTSQQVVGTVKGFNVKNRFSFINHNDTSEDIFVYHRAITRNNPQEIKWSVGGGKRLECRFHGGSKGSRSGLHIMASWQTGLGHPLCHGQMPVPKPLVPQVRTALSCNQQPTWAWEQQHQRCGGDSAAATAPALGIFRQAFPTTLPVVWPRSPRSINATRKPQGQARRRRV